MKGAVVLAFLCAAVPAAAQEDGDLARIPSAVDSAVTAPPPPAPHGKYFIQDAFSVLSRRGTFAVPYPSPPASPWANRTSLDALDHWSLTDNLSFHLSDRLDVGFADGVAFPGDAVRNDFREGYLSWEPVAQTYFEVGRINVRNGIAYGFNPTDFFKTRTRVAQSSADPSAQRENRLGTVMLRGQTFWDGGSLTVAYAPKLRSPTSLFATGNWIDPGFGQTNGADRILVSLNIDDPAWSPEALVYHESGRTRFGLNLSHLVGQSIVLHAEWAGGEAPSVIVDALAFGKATGIFPPFVPPLPATRMSRSFENDLAIGGTWSSADEVMVTLEYEFHQAGFTSGDWRNWFDAGAADPAAASQLWYIRAYAADQQEPMSRHQAFARVSWDDAFILHLSLSAIAFTNLTDGSTTAQVAANYDINDNWSIGGYFGGSFGGRRTEWGSVPSAASAILQVSRYL